MPWYKGNVGNLMQHWVLAELLSLAARNEAHIDFVDAHSMAPLANDRLPFGGTSVVLDAVKDSLPGQRSSYERAWGDLIASGDGYPNSAAFLVAIWPHSYTLLLCEKDPETVPLLQAWATKAELSDKCLSAIVAEGNWRNTFRQGLPEVTGLRVLSFDPYMFDRNGPPKKPNTGNMYPPDLELLASSVDDSESIAIQLSTFSANNNNGQAAVIDTIDPILEAHGISRLAVVRADGNMMSLVYGRGLSWSAELGSLPQRFDAWLAGPKSRANGNGPGSKRKRP